MTNTPKENIHKDLKNRIMGRVYRSWLMRSVAPLFIIEFALILIALYFFAQLIFVGAVVDNALNAALGNPFKFAEYLVSSFFAARIEVQAIIVIFAVAAILLLKAVNRGIISYLMVRKNRVIEK